MAGGYVPSTIFHENLFRKLIDLPNPEGRLRASIIGRYINCKKEVILDRGCRSGVYTPDLVKKGFFVVGVDAVFSSMIQVKKNSERIVKILKDDDLRDKLSRNVLVWAKNFDWKKRLCRFERIVTAIGKTDGGKRDLI